MYTRSYSDKNGGAPLPPDYSGTALTLRPPSAETPTRAALTRQSTRATAFGRDITPRYPTYSEENYRESGDEVSEGTAPPFGIYGQNGEGQDRENEPSQSASIGGNRCDKPLIDLSKLKSDDLLLLGLAFLIFSDKEREGEMPVDALLILATLFLSGL